MSNENQDPSLLAPPSEMLASAENSAAPESNAEAPAATAAEPSAASPVEAATPASTAPAAIPPPSSDAPVKRPMTIGSQRDPADPRLSPVQPKQVREARTSGPRPERGSKPASSGLPIPIPQVGAVPIPNRRDKDEELERELAEAMGEASIEQLVEEAGAANNVELEADSRVKATVTRLHLDNVFFALKGRYEGVASVRSFKTPPELGAMLEVVVRGYLPDDGLYEVGIPGGAIDVADWEDIEPGSVVEARITGSNTGGLECMVNTIRGFIPASQIDLHRTENFGEYVNQKMTCVVTEANRARKNLVLSRRALLEKTLEEERKTRLESIEIGSTVPGKVTRLMEFGAFVDIGGGVEGLVHISKMSWDRIEHPKEVFETGQQIQVKIDKVNPDNGKISLSYRDTIVHPWEGIEDRYPVGAVVKGRVSRIAQFGAFVKLEPGVEGLIHISELAHHRVVTVKNHVKEGDEVEVKVLAVDAEAQKMGLSLKALQTAPERPNAKAEELIDDTARASAVPKHEGELKGGRDQPSGGDRFGLKW